MFFLCEHIFMTQRTLFSTADPFCAHLAGFDEPLEPGWDGGFSVTFDSEGGVPSAILTLTDGEVIGLAALRQLADALLTAERLARAG